MIAELHNKINPTTSSYAERGEDELTGNFFGCMRYLPFEKALKPILSYAAYPVEEIACIKMEKSPLKEDYISFWPRYLEDQKQTEFDVVIELEHVIIGIEVKYRSDLSSDDDVDYTENEEIESCNQLVREARLLEKIGKNKKKVLLLVADEVACAEIYKDVQARKLIKNVNFAYLSWQKILEVLKTLSGLGVYEKIIIKDLTELLKKKGFEHFQNFNVAMECFGSSYWEFDGKIALDIDFNHYPTIRRGGYYEFK